MSAADAPRRSEETVPAAEDRNRQITAAAWILGWIGGPLPAVVMLLATDTPPWSRRLIRSAAVFWTIAWVVLWGLVAAELAGQVPAFAAWWIGAIVVAFAATVAGARAALRRSEQSDDRQAW